MYYCLEEFGVEMCETVTCERWYAALCDVLKEALLMRAVLVFLQLDLTGMRVDIFQDNQRANLIRRSQYCAH